MRQNIISFHTSTQFFVINARKTLCTVKTQKIVSFNATKYFKISCEETKTYLKTQQVLFKILFQHTLTNTFDFALNSTL